jgi:glycosyltransferase involved in cell wall biosynthesis
MTLPVVSVVMAVRNGAAELSRSIDSILTQTFANFEFIVVNDGSTDETAEVLGRIGDPRMRVVHQENRGLAVALNRGISLARGVYIARQDHDDWAKPARLEKQLAYMQANPDCALIGTRSEIWRGAKRSARAHDFPCGNAELQFELLFDNPFVHSSVMLRKAAVEAVCGYCADPARQPEDYELWSRLARRYEVANLPERLTIYREMPGSITRTGRYPFQRRVALLCAENLAAAAGEGGPGTVHHDIAALTHHVYDEISPRPDAEAISRVIRTAGEWIASRFPGSDLAEPVAARIANIRHALEIQQLRAPSIRRLLYRARRSWWAQQLKLRVMG